MTPKIENVLVQNEKSKKIKQGGHLNWNEVKSGILVFILKNGPVLESKIREFVEKSYNIKNQKTVNKHLHDLEKLNCIKRISEKRGLPNHWDTNTRGNLKYIKKEFPNIHLIEYTKTKNITIKTNFPGIGPRHEKKYFVFMSLFSALFDTFLDNEFEPMLASALELWDRNDYKDTVNSLTDFVYDRSFLRDNSLERMVDRSIPPTSKQIIEISKDELKTILAEIQYPYDEQDWGVKKEIVENKLLEKLTKVVLSKRPNNTEDQVQREVSEKIINRLYYTSKDGVFKIVRYQHLRMYKIYDRLCKHFYEDDFLRGKSSQEAKTFVDELEKCISRLNSEEIEDGINDLEALYDEWYNKCLKIDEARLIRRNVQPEN